MRLIFLGPQGSGKGTQGTLLRERLGFAYFAMGDALRNEVKEQTAIGKEIKQILDDGKLVPNEITNRLIEGFLKRHDHALIDGYPRNLEQAEFFDSVVEADAVVVLKISDDTAVKRLSGRRVCKNGHTYHVEHNPPKTEGICDIDGLPLQQRTDDTEEAIRQRLAIYHKETQEVLARYRERIIEVDAERPIEEVHAEIVTTLRERGLLEDA